jgi:hypothetical protein
MSGLCPSRDKAKTYCAVLKIDVVFVLLSVLNFYYFFLSGTAFMHSVVQLLELFVLAGLDWFIFYKAIYLILFPSLLLLSLLFLCCVFFYRTQSVSW